MSITVLAVEDEPISRERLEKLLLARTDLEIIGVFGAADDVLLQLNKSVVPDILITDIALPGLSGMELAKAFGDYAIKPQVIFVTAFSEHAVQAFDIEALDYVLKPYSKNRLYQAIDKAKRQCNNNKVGDKCDRFMVTHLGRSRFILFKEIIAVQIDDKTLTLFTHDEQHQLDMPLKDALAILPQPPFRQINRSIGVNMDHVSEMHDLFNGAAEMHMKNGLVFSVSRRYRRRFS